MFNKRLLATSLFAAALLIGCSANEPQNVESEEGTTPQVTITDDDSSNEEQDQVEQEEQQEQEQEMNIEQVLFENDDYKVTLLSLEDSYWGQDLKVRLENNSDENVTVQVRGCSVNGFMVDPIFSEDIAAGKKSNSEISFSSSSLEEQNIKTINEVELSFEFFDSDSYDTLLETDKIQIKLSDNNAEEETITGTTLYDEGGIKIIYKNTTKDDLFDDINMNLYIENNTDQSITIQARDTSVDGYMMDPTMSIDIEPGKKINDDLSFSSYDLEENSITTFSSVETSFLIMDDNYDDIALVPVSLEVEITE